MNRSDIIAEAAKALGGKPGDKQTATQVVEVMIDLIADGLATGERVHVTGLGGFRAEPVPERPVRNPGTGKTSMAKPTARIKFQPAGDLIARLTKASDNS